MLTQQTTWTNVEKAIANLKDSTSLDIKKIANMPLGKLEKLIKPSGFYRQKASRLKELSKRILKEHGTFNEMLSLDKQTLRKTLLSYNGIGKETADSIILYAANKPIFVIDAYTRRSMGRISKMDKNLEYDALRNYFESNIKKDLRLYKDFHAQFVQLGKNYCRSKPKCVDCPLNKMCEFGIKNAI
jgi:endonuclease III related protein